MWGEEELSEDSYILAHDVGTTSNKTCLYRLGEQIELVDSALAAYPLYTLPNGGVEQEADDWWSGIVGATRTILGRTEIDFAQIRGMAFCATRAPARSAGQRVSARCLMWIWTIWRRSSILRMWRVN